MVINKYIYDINKEELFFLKENSFINEYVFYGRLLVLQNNLTQKQLIDNFYNLYGLVSIEVINDCVFLANNYYENKSFDAGVLFLEYLNNIIKQVQTKENIDLLLDKYRYSFISIYLIIDDIENSVFESVLGKFSYFRWRLWNSKFIRSKDINTEEYPIINAMILAENGLYEEALVYLDKELQRNYLNDFQKIIVDISIYYYKMMIQLKLKKWDDINKTIVEFEKHLNTNYKLLRNHKNTTFLKISLFYLNIYEASKNDIYLEKYKEYLLSSFQMIYNDKSMFEALPQAYIENIKEYEDFFTYKTFNIEYLREYFLNIITYSSIKGENNDNKRS